MRGDSTARWVKTTVAQPEHNKRRDSFGTEVLIWPPHKSEGQADAHTAFYGRRISADAAFYLHGAILHPQPAFWARLPDGPELI